MASHDEFVLKIWVTKRALQKASKVPILAVFVILAIFVITLAKRVEYYFFDFSTLRTQKSESLIFIFNMFPLFKIKFQPPQRQFFPQNPFILRIIYFNFTYFSKKLFINEIKLIQYGWNS